MVYKKWPALVLFAVAFIILSISGYQCAGPGSQGLLNNGLQGPQGPNPYQDSSSNSGGPTLQGSDSNSEDPSLLASNSDPDSDDEPRNNCPRKTLRRLEENEGTKATFKFFSNAALTEFRLGSTPNYDNACSRLYLDMHKTQYGNANVYEGSMSLVYVGTCANGQEGICRTRMTTGHGAEDARYNRWTAGTWSTSSNGVVNSKKKFHAIFEDTDGYGAYILKMDHFREVDVGDGVVGYRGWAELFFKMTRTATQSDVHRVDKAGDCYNTGTYISLAREIPNNRPSIRCWFVNTGPFHCRPNGDLLINASFTNINITTNNYKCYRKLGTMYSIDVRKAFNTSDVTKL